MGAISADWAMIMARGVNRKPERAERPRAGQQQIDQSPTTTGGRPMQPLRKTISDISAGKRESATSAPSGSPITQVATVADSVTSKDKATMPNSFGSPERTRSRALDADEHRWR